MKHKLVIRPSLNEENIVFACVNGWCPSYIEMEKDTLLEIMSGFDVLVNLDLREWGKCSGYPTRTPSTDSYQRAIERESSMRGDGSWEESYRNRVLSRE